MVSLITALPQTRWVRFEQTCYDQFPKLLLPKLNTILTADCFSGPMIAVCLDWGGGPRIRSAKQRRPAICFLHIFGMIADLSFPFEIRPVSIWSVKWKGITSAGTIWYVIVNKTLYWVFQGEILNEVAEKHLSAEIRSLVSVPTSFLVCVVWLKTSNFLRIPFIKFLR